MEAHELARGELAPKEGDRIKLKRLVDGKFGYEAIHTTGTVMHHSTFHDVYETEAEALQAALHWAERCKIEHVYIERPTNS